MTSTVNPILDDLLGDVAGLNHLDSRIRRQLTGHGTTVDVGGTRAERWALDPVPYVVDAATWDRIGAAGAQRARLLDAVLADLYGPQRLLADGLLAPEAVFAHPGYLRPCVGISAAPWLVTSAVDVASSGGDLLVLADRTEAPSGAGYALENRSLIARAHSELFHRSAVGRLGDWFATLRATLARAAPPGVSDPRVVILTPGPLSDTSFEHSYLARALGFTLVEPADLTVRDGAVWLKSVTGPELVNVILRRIDAAWCDSLELRGDSMLGVAGLVEAARRGSVSIVNPLGSGLAENQAIFAASDRLCEVILGEDPLLPTVPTWWCGDPASRSHVLANLDRLVVKPIARGAGRQSRFGRLLTRQAREELQGRILARPHLYVGQAEAALDRSPSYSDGRVRRRHAVARAFLVSDGDGYQWMQGGLARVADRPELVTMASGGVSQDTWVVGAARPFAAPEPAPLPQVDLRLSLTGRAAESMFWIGRNLERADTVIRVVRAIEQRLEQWPDLRDEAHGAYYDAVTVTAARLAALTQDRDHLTAALGDPGASRSAVTSLHYLITGARTVRELFSLDTWHVLGEIQRGHLRLSLAEGPEHHEAAGSLLTPLLAFSGLLSESMVRDPGWLFLDLGRRIERSLLLIETLNGAFAVPPPAPVAATLYETVLAGWDSLVAYRRRHRSDVDAREMVELLVNDASNPRSVTHQLERISDDLEVLPARPAGLLVATPVIRGEPWGIAAQLDDLAVRLHQMVDALHLHYFVQVRQAAIGS